MTNILNIAVGEQYCYRGENYLVVDIQGTDIHLRSTKDSTHFICQSRERLVYAHERGQFYKVQEAPFKNNGAVICAALSPRQRNIMERRLEFVRRVTERLGGHLPKQRTLAVIAEIADTRKESPPSYQTVRNWCKAYWDGGEQCLALVPRTYRVRYHRLFKQPKIVQDIIMMEVTRLYWVPTPISKVDLIDVITCGIRAENLQRSPHQQLAVPSSSTLYRIIMDLDPYETDRHQHGRLAANRKHKWGQCRERPELSLSMVEGDTHEVDLQTRDDKGQLRGRPWLTAFIHVRNRVIVGWDLSYNPPCVAKSMRALKHSLQSQNPYGGLVPVYRVDNGSEFTGKRFKSAVTDLGAAVSFCQPGVPDNKPFIESFFNTWTHSIAQYMRGTTFSKPNEYDALGNAIYSLETLQLLFADWLEKVYHSGEHSGLNMSPHEAWLKDIEDQGFHPKRFSDEDLDRHFLCVAYLTPNKGRLRFKGLSWTGPGVSHLEHKLPGKQLRLSYDLSELGHGWVSDPHQPSQPFPVVATNPEYQVGLTMDLHMEIRKAQLARKKLGTYLSPTEDKVRILAQIAMANEKRKSNTKPKTKAEGGKPLKKPSTVIKPETNPPAGPLNPKAPGSYQIMDSKEDDDDDKH